LRGDLLSSDIFKNPIVPKKRAPSPVLKIIHRVGTKKPFTLGDGVIKLRKHNRFAA